MRILGLAFLGLLAAVASAAAYPAVTTAPAVMRTAADPRARVVQTIPPNAEIDVTNCTARWCYASWRDIFGYIPFSTVAALAEPPAPYYPAPPVVVVPGWGWRNGWGPGYYGGHWRHRW